MSLKDNAHFLVLLLCMATASIVHAERVENLKIRAINLSDGQSTVTPGSGLDLEIEFQSSTTFKKEQMIDFDFYLVAPEGSAQVTLSDITSNPYLGYTHSFSPVKGLNTFQARVQTAENLSEGEFELFAVINASGQVKEPIRDNLYRSGIILSVDPENRYDPALEIVDFEPSQSVIIFKEQSPNSVNGLLVLEAQFTDIELVTLEYCIQISESECRSVQVWDTESQSFLEQTSISNLEDRKFQATQFTVLIPEDLRDELIPHIGKAYGDKFTLKVNASDESGLSASASKEIALFPPLPINPYLNTDYGRELQQKANRLRNQLRSARRSGKVPSLLDDLRKTKSRSSTLLKEDQTDFGVISLKQAMNMSLRQVRKTLVGFYRAAYQANTVEQYHGSTPASTLAESRFNMSDADFAWLFNINVDVPPPPTKFNGNNPYASYALWERCIPYFCGPVDQSKTGTAPSQACIRYYCGTTKEDIRFGGRNPSLYQKAYGLDSKMSYKGFGFDVGLGSDFEIYADKAINNYVATSAGGHGHFAIKVFNKTVNIFEARLTAVASPTELDNSYMRMGLWFLGLKLQAKEGKTEVKVDGLSATAGYQVKSDVSIAGKGLTLEGKAGGTVGLDIAVQSSTEEDGLKVIIAPWVKLGTSVEVSTAGPGVSFWVSGSLDLVEDRLEESALMDVNLDIVNRRITPSLVFDISNRLLGPKGSLEVGVKFGVDPFTVSGSLTLASFSTFEKKDTLVNTTIKSPPISY